MTRPAVKPLYVHAAHVQEHFSIHRSTIYRWAKLGHIRIIKRGRASLVKVAEVEAYIEGLGDQLGDRAA